MERAPVRISIDLVQRERRHVISFPRMEPTGDGMILGFLKVAARRIWLEEVESPRRIRRRWAHLCQAPVTIGSSTRWDNRRAHMRRIIRRWLLLLVVRLESLDSVTGTSIASWVSRNHCGSNWASSSSTRTVEKGVNFNLVCNLEESKRKRVMNVCLNEVIIGLWANYGNIERGNCSLPKLNTGKRLD